MFLVVLSPARWAAGWASGLGGQARARAGSRPARHLREGRVIIIPAKTAVPVSNALTKVSTVMEARLLVTAGYWLTLALGAIQVGRIVATISTSVVTPPSPARLRLGIGILAVGSALASWISLSSIMAGSGFDGVSAAAGGCLLILTCMFISLLRDLSHC
jgi:hypothetical protein